MNCVSLRNSPGSSLAMHDKAALRMWISPYPCRGAVKLQWNRLWQPERRVANEVAVLSKSFLFGAKASKQAGAIGFAGHTEKATRRVASSEGPKNGLWGKTKNFLER